jgi:hypothetical protein
MDLNKVYRNFLQGMTSVQATNTRMHEQDEQGRNYLKLVDNRNAGGCCGKCAHKKTLRHGMLHCTPKNKQIKAYNICHKFEEIVNESDLESTQQT